MEVVINVCGDVGFVVRERPAGGHGYRLESFVFLHLARCSSAAVFDAEAPLVPFSVRVQRCMHDGKTDSA